MRVLFIYKFLTTGGVEAVLRGRSRALSSAGINSTFWFLEYIDGHSIFSDEDERLQIGGLSELGGHLRRAEYDVISIIDTPEVFPLLRKATHSTILIEAHSPYLDNLEYLRSLQNVRVSAILVPTQYQAQIVRKRLREPLPVVVIPNPLDDAFLQPSEATIPLPRQPIVAWAGRFDSLKNWKAYVQIASQLSKIHEEVAFWMAGRLPQVDEWPTLYKQIKRSGVLPQLRWFENFPHDRMPRFFDLVRKSGGVVVSTSKGESFGLVVAEAMARGCAVVVPTIGPFREFIADEINGLFYREGSVSEAVEKIQRLLTNKVLRDRLAEQGRKSIVAGYAPDVANRTLVKFLKSISNRSIHSIEKPLAP